MADHRGQFPRHNSNPYNYAAASSSNPAPSPPRSATSSPAPSQASSQYSNQDQQMSYVQPMQQSAATGPSRGSTSPVQVPCRRCLANLQRRANELDRSVGSNQPICWESVKAVGCMCTVIVISGYYLWRTGRSQPVPGFEPNPPNATTYSQPAVAFPPNGTRRGFQGPRGAGYQRSPYRG